jgi:SynChlorMet cassette radical SAM/SPASM protein ScmE
MEKARRTDAERFSNGGRLTGCGCPASKIGVRADGVIVPCTMLSHMELGRINQDTLQDIWQNNKRLYKLRTRHLISLDSFAECTECAYVPYCTGNCPGLAFTLTGDVDRPSPDACLKHFLNGGGKIPMLTNATSMK